MAKLPSDEIQRLLKEVITHFNKEDRSVRERQIRQWRRLKLFWEGFHKTWYSEVAHDWRIWDETQIEDNNQSYYDKPVNIFRAYLESIIAALSVTVPPVKCYPDDADDTLDLSTAKAGDKIAQLLFRHNNASLLWLHALFIFMTEGLVGCYSYPKSDEKYGTYDKNEYEDDLQEQVTVQCPSCGYNLSTSNPQDDHTLEMAKDTEDKFMPDDGDVPVLDYMNNTAENELCPACMSMISPLISKESFIVTRLVGVTKEPKTRICMETYGGLNIKVPNYARNQSECPYLFFYNEVHYSVALQRYKDLDTNKIRGKIQSSGLKDTYEEWGRLSPQYNGEYPEGVVTISENWLRPCAFNVLDLDDANLLKKKYPSGVKVCLVNDEFAEACNSALDDSWTLTYNPMSDFIHHDPLGLLLVSIQELTNDLISLIIQTIEHGIPQTFADPGVVNFDAYRQLEATPGGLYEAKPKSGAALGDGFYEVRTATLSGEVLPFLQQLQSLAQLVSGALPSLFGGQMESGGNTASEYSMSRAQALQRLQNNWKMMTSWWKNIFGKAIPMFIKEVKEDEREVQRKPDGSFINVFIRKAELEGKIGKIELEANENLPITWNQRKDVIMQLLNAQNPEILAMLGTPENLPIIREAIGLDSFFVPGEDDRNQTLDYIKLLLNSTPISTPPQIDPATGQPISGPSETSSIEPDPIYDNPQIAFEMIRKWVISEEGRQNKIDNPDGYKNVLLLGQQYQMLMQQAQMNQMAQQAPNGANPTKPNQDMKAPIQGENNVQSAQ